MDFLFIRKGCLLFFSIDFFLDPLVIIVVAPVEREGRILSREFQRSRGEVESRDTKTFDFRARTE